MENYINLLAKKLDCKTNLTEGIHKWDKVFNKNKNADLNEDLIILLDNYNIQLCADDVVESYQNATKWLDTIKETVYIDFGCVFFSSYIHKLAHTMPERFDKFGNILHTVNIKINYPETREIPAVPENIDLVFNLIFEILSYIKLNLNIFIKYTDNNFHGLSCAAEQLLNDIESEFVPLYRMKKAFDNCNNDLVSFDKWIHLYIDNKDKLTESLNESINKGTINKSINYLESNGFEVEVSNNTLNQFNIKTPDKTLLCLAFLKGKDYFLVYGADGHKYSYPYDTKLYSYIDIVNWVDDVKEFENIDDITESLNESSNENLKNKLMEFLDFLIGYNCPHPDNWLSTDWEDDVDSIKMGLEDPLEMAMNLLSYMKGEYNYIKNYGLDDFDSNSITTLYNELNKIVKSIKYDNWNSKHVNKNSDPE